MTNKIQIAEKHKHPSKYKKLSTKGVEPHTRLSCPKPAPKKFRVQTNNFWCDIQCHCNQNHKSHHMLVKIYEMWKTQMSQNKHPTPTLALILAILAIPDAVLEFSQDPMTGAVQYQAPTKSLKNAFLLIPDARHIKFLNVYFQCFVVLFSRSLFVSKSPPICTRN